MANKFRIQDGIISQGEGIFEGVKTPSVSYSGNIDLNITGVEFVGYIDDGFGGSPGATLHVTSITSGTITDGMTIYGAGLPAEGWTLTFGTVMAPQGSGGTGNYYLSGANLLIASQTFNGPPSKSWAFQSDGKLALPAGGDIVDSTGTSVLGGGGSGTQGIQGLQGADGVQGITGADGLQGLPGMDGSPGTPGIDGAPGADGLQGTEGLQGTQGLQGPAGNESNTTVIQISSDPPLNPVVGQVYYDSDDGEIYICTVASPTATWVDSSPSTTYGDSNVTTLLSSFGANTITTTGDITAGEVLTDTVTGTGTDVTLEAGSYSFVFDNTGKATMPGALEVTGTATINGTSSNVTRRAFGLVETDTYVTLDDIKAKVTSSSQLSLMLVSGSWQGTGWTETFQGGGTPAVNNWINLPLSSGFDNASGAMPNQGNGCRCVISDQTPSAKVYQITVVRSGTTGAMWNISIERLV